MSHFVNHYRYLLSKYVIHVNSSKSVFQYSKVSILSYIRLKI